MRDLTLTDTSLVYARGGVHAMRNISMTIEAGKTLALVGESGSGKSSTARVVAGLQAPTSGQRTWSEPPAGSHARGSKAAADPRVQMVFQHPDQSLNPLWSVGRSVAEPLRRAGVTSRKELAERTASMLVQVGLDEGFAERRPRDLSGGQAQRVAVARALVAEPEVVILDEPTASLDQTVRNLLLEALEDLQTTLGTGYLLITHDMSSAQRLADRVMVMRAGQILEEGPTSVVLTSPAHPYTKALIDAVPPIDPRAGWDPATVGKDLVATVCPVPGDCSGHSDELTLIAPDHLVRCVDAGVAAAA